MILLVIVNIYLLACAERLAWSLSEDEIDPTASLNNHISMEPDNEMASTCELISQDLMNIVATLTQSMVAAQIPTRTSMSPPTPALSPSGSLTCYSPTPPHITGKPPATLTLIISPAQSWEPSPIPVSLLFSSQTPLKCGHNEDKVLSTKWPWKNTSTAPLSSPVSSSTLNSMVPALTVVVTTVASPTINNSCTSSAFDKLWEGVMPVSNNISPPHNAEKYICTSLIMLNVDTLGPDWVKLVGSGTIMKKIAASPRRVFPCPIHPRNIPCAFPSGSRMLNLLPGGQKTVSLSQISRRSSGNGGVTCSLIGGLTNQLSTLSVSTPPNPPCNGTILPLPTLLEPMVLSNSSQLFSCVQRFFIRKVAASRAGLQQCGMLFGLLSIFQRSQSLKFCLFVHLVYLKTLAINILLWTVNSVNVHSGDLWNFSCSLLMKEGRCGNVLSKCIFSVLYCGSKYINFVMK